MATSLEFAQFIQSQIQVPQELRLQKLFGEYALYANGKIVFLICDGKLFGKVSPAGLGYSHGLPMAPPYPGAKDWLHLSEKIDEGDWLSQFVILSYPELPEPKVKSKKNKV